MVEEEEEEKEEEEGEAGIGNSVRTCLFVCLVS